MYLTGFKTNNFCSQTFHKFSTHTTVLANNFVNSNFLLRDILLLAKLIKNQINHTSLDNKLDVSLELSAISGESTLTYDLLIDKINNSYKEELIKHNINSELLILKRDDNEVKLYYSGLDKLETVSCINNELLIHRSDKIQHPTINLLHSWAKCIRYYSFSGEMGQNYLSQIDDYNINNDSNYNLGISYFNKDSIYIVDIFKEALLAHQDDFESELINDLTYLGFDIKHIEYDGYPSFIKIKQNTSNEWIHQFNINRHLFKCLSLLIQLNYFIRNYDSGLVLIEDVFEGLDNSVCEKFKDLLLKKLSNNINLIATTNNLKCIIGDCINIFN